MRTIAVGLGLLLAGCAQSPSEWIVDRRDLPAPRVVRLPTRTLPPAQETPRADATARPLEVEVLSIARAPRIESTPRPPRVEARPVARVAPPARREGPPPCET